MTPPLQLSATQFSSASDCWRQWWFRYVQRMPSIQDDSTTFGSVLHEVAERWVGADDQGRDHTGTPVDPYPAGWDRQVTPKEAAEIRALVTAGIEQGVLRRMPGRVIEGEFQTPVIPGVTLKGKIDVLLPDGVEDHKSAKTMRFVLSEEALQTDPQLLIYGHECLSRNPKLTEVSVRHNVFCREGKVRGTGPVMIQAEEINRFWTQSVVPFAQNAVELRAKGLKDEEWAKVSGPAPGSNACKKYRGCAFASVCGYAETPAAYRERIARVTAPKPAQPKESKVGIFDKLSKPKTVAPAPVTVAQTVAAVAPTLAPTPAPVKQDLTDAVLALTSKMKGPTLASTLASTVAPTEGASSFFIPLPFPPAAAVKVEGAAPWANPDCKACGGTGINVSKGLPCKACKIVSEHRHGPLPHQYNITIEDGCLTWSLKELTPPQDSAPMTVSEDSGSVQIVPDVVVSEPPTKRGRGRPSGSRNKGPKDISSPMAKLEEASQKVIEEITQAAIDGAVVAPNAHENLLAPTQASEEVPAAFKQTWNQLKPRMTLVIGAVVARGADNVVDLHDVFAQNAAELAEDAKEPLGYYAMNAFHRRDMLASQAATIAAQMSGMVVVANGESPDFKTFVESLIPFAGMVIRGVA